MAYPRALVNLPMWHSIFNSECINFAATFPAILDAGNLAKILANKNFVATLINAAGQAKNYGQEVVEYRDIYLRAPLGTLTPANPVLPGGIAAPLGVVVGIDDFTRGIIGQLDAHPNMTDAIRAAMGILPEPSALGTVSIRSAAAQASSEVALRLGMAGYEAVAVYLKRNGVTVRLGVSMDADFTDETAPLVAGQSESREYWIRGIVDNVEQGDISATVLVATTP